MSLVDRGNSGFLSSLRSSRFLKFFPPAVLFTTYIGYILCKAALLSITHDEALTYREHVLTGWADIFFMRGIGLPDNNHILFTLLAKLSITLFGLSNLSFRLPSIVGAALFFLAMKRILSRSMGGWRLHLALAAVLFVPYLCDFMSLARGYGLALGLSMIGIERLIAFVERPDKGGDGRAMLGLILLGLAVFANLAFLIVLVPAGLILVGRVVEQTLRSPQPDWKAGFLRLSRIGLAALPALALDLIPITVLTGTKFIEKGYGGGSRGFLTDTVGSLISAAFYSSPDFLKSRPAIVLLVLFGVLPALGNLFFRRVRIGVAMAVPGGLILLMIVQSYAQFILMDVAFLEGRRALFLIPLFLLFWLPLLLGTKREAQRPSRLLSGASGGLAAILALMGILGFDPYTTYEWGYDADTRSIMGAVASLIREKHPTRPLSLRTDWILEPACNFYRGQLGLEQIAPIDREGYDLPADLYIVPADKASLLAGRGVRLIRQWDRSGMALFASDALLR